MSNSTTRFLIDSTLVSTLDEAKSLNVEVVPLYITINNQSKKDLIDAQPNEVYEALREGHVAMTSQPAVGDFLERYEQLKEEGAKTIYAFTISSDLSGTYQSANQAAELIEDVTVHVIDTGYTTAMCFEIIKEIMAYSQTHTEDETLAYAKEAFKSLGLYATVGSLDYLVRGGRLKKSNALIANLLKIKPVLSLFAYGEIKAIAKERTQRKCFQTIADLVKEHHPKDLMILTTDDGNAETAHEFKTFLESQFPETNFKVSTLCSVIGAHTGPEVSVLCFR